MVPQQARAATESIVHRFVGGRAGTEPQGSLLALGGLLYGTADGGDAAADGIVFSMTPTRTEKILHFFTNGPDGSAPNGSLVNVNGTLYGTTYFGGSSEYSSGIVFSITPAGVEKVVYSFQGGSDGANPTGGLISIDGILFGTTFGGGANGLGTVFRLTTQGKENVIYSFRGGDDGAHPLGVTLINVLGTLYGTTAEGGDGCQGGCGTVFTVTKLGSEKVLYSFKGNTDGQQPNGLVYLQGNFYGTTTDGGAANCGYGGPFPLLACGTVFEMTPAGAEKVLYVFGQGTRSDGYEPFMSSLTVLNGTLWGVCANGYVNGQTEGGTVFSITPKGVYTLVHAFTGKADGAYPESTLVNVSGTLYGMTMNGGGTANAGTVFKIVP